MNILKFIAFIIGFFALVPFIIISFVIDIFGFTTSIYVCTIFDWWLEFCLR